MGSGLAMIMSWYLKYKNYFNWVNDDQIIHTYIHYINYLLSIFFAFKFLNFHNKRKYQKDLPIIISKFVISVKEFKSANDQNELDNLFERIISITPAQYKDLLQEIKTSFVTQTETEQWYKSRTERMNKIYEVAKHLGCLERITN